MNRTQAMKKLQAWDEDESFYREYYLAAQTGSGTDELFSREDIPEEVKQNAAHPENIDPNKTEEMFFASGRNVLLIKHPRYLPFFLHRHAFFEMLYVLEGGCTQTIGESRIALSRGDLCLLSPGVSHGIEVFDDSIVVNILIRQSTFLDIFLNAVRDKSRLSRFFLGSLTEKGSQQYLLYRTGSETAVRECVLDMAAEQEQLDDYSDRVLCALLTILFTRLTRQFGQSVEEGKSGGQTSPLADQMMAYLLDHAETVSLAELSRHFHFSVPYCSKLIKAASGQSFSELVTQIRLRQGENLLFHTQLSVAEVSERLGFKNPETFIRSFSRIFGMSPAQYRRKAA